MLRRKQEINQQLQQFIDAFLLLFAFWASYAVRVYAHVWFPVEEIPPFREFQWMIVVIMLCGPLLLESQGFYEHPLLKDWGRTMTQLGRSLVGLALLVGLCVMFMRVELPSRAVLILFVAIGLALLLAKDRYLLSLARQQAARGQLREPVLLVGLPEDMDQFVATFSREQTLLMEIVERVDIEKQPLEALVTALHRHAISKVIFAATHAHLHTVQEAINACETEGVEAWLVADFVKTAIAKPSIEAVGGRPVLVFRSTPDASWALLGKRVIDLAASFLGLIVLALPLAVVALIIKATSPGPMFFTQLRGGRYGKPFTMYKFRSMRTDAEMRRAEFEVFNEMSGPVFKLDNDPRVTAVGRFIRKLSIDELPQLYNVLRGDMSLVGPRPLPLYEVEKFETTAQRRRLSVQPGLTCLWQISGRNEIKNFQDWVRLDLKYIDNWSLWLDIKILFMTIPVVLLGSGAK